MSQETEKLLKNELFFVAVDYLYKNGMVSSQGELAKLIGISEAGLSRIKNNKKSISDDTLRKMNDAFGGIFNMAYFRGQSTVLLTEDENHYNSHPGSHPFSAAAQTPSLQNAPSSTVEPSSLMNAALAAQMKTIEALEHQLLEKDDELRARLSDKDSQLADLRALLKEKDAHIATLKSRVADLERSLTFTRTFNSRDLTDYPYPVGVADSHDSTSQNPNVSPK